VVADSNGGTLPADFAQAQADFAGTKVEGDNSTDDGLSPEQFEIVYAGKLEEVKKPSETIQIREKEERPTPDGGLVKTYGFVDGHSEVHKAASHGDFVTWEKERIQSNAQK
jgi:hypothetical protein